MATSSKDIETLWNRYSNEVNKQGISVAQFFESNGIPYHVFEKWYKKRMQPSSVVDCVVSCFTQYERYGKKGLRI